MRHCEAVYRVPGVGGDGDQEAVHHEQHHAAHVVKLEHQVVDADLLQVQVLGHLPELSAQFIIHPGGDMAQCL